MRSAEGQKLPRDDPVQISVLNPLRTEAASSLWLTHGKHYRPIRSTCWYWYWCFTQSMESGANATCTGQSGCTWIPEGKLANQWSGPRFKVGKPEEFSPQPDRDLTTRKPTATYPRPDYSPATQLPSHDRITAHNATTYELTTTRPRLVLPGDQPTTRLPNRSSAW
ncbi:hypothetical protein EYF80_063268 [Liparis tanakae]|uniref:Uncharacterized protein n=1 Tax=Liparis tanakae TaxID=230148 RepID=A0A4Z2ECY2_9TELE|nr:hypothetical protein EYF80_063268 [Liparis tanakae]